MRFHYGEIPKAEGFDPEADGWASIREPSPLLMNGLAIPAAFLMCGLTVGLLSLAGEGGPPVILRPSEVESASLSFMLILAIILLSIPVHEVVHAFGHPHFGLSSNSVLGLWLTRGLFYAHYEGEMSRNRFLAILTLPFLVLSMLPVIIVGLAGPSMSTAILGYLVIVALTNSVLASGDVVGFGLILSQIPSSAIVRNQGWKSFWKQSSH